MPQRQPGMKSLSILETEGIPLLQGLDVSSNSNEEIKLLSALRQVSCAFDPKPETLNPKP